MGEVPRSLHMDAELSRRLDEEARRQDVSADSIAEEAIEQYLDFEARKREMIRTALAEADKGVFISEEAMSRWVESWDTDNELPPPKPDIFPTGGR